MAVILISAYKGNLLAMITKPLMNAPFTNADEMVQQSGMKWGIWEKEAEFTRVATSRPAANPKIIPRTKGLKK